MSLSNSIAWYSCCQARYFFLLFFQYVSKNSMDWVNGMPLAWLEALFFPSFFPFSGFFTLYTSQKASFAWLPCTLIGYLCCCAVWTVVCYKLVKKNLCLQMVGVCCFAWRHWFQWRRFIQTANEGSGVWGNYAADHSLYGALWTVHFLLMMLWSGHFNGTSFHISLIYRTRRN